MSKLKTLLNSPAFKALAKEAQLRELIRTTSQLYGGDSPEDLLIYTSEQLSTWSGNIDIAIRCFEDIITHKTQRSKSL